MSQPAPDFSTLGLSKSTLDAIAAKGFSVPSPIQAAVIPACLSQKNNIIAQAATGTGKTAAFALPIIELLQHRPATAQALILTPTRELAMQIAEEFASLAANSNLSVGAVFGGQNIFIQLDKLKKGLDVVVGTPGRVIDLMERGALKFDALSFAVLDEADEMLDMGFVEDIEKILAATPAEKRTLLFSATLPKEIQSIAAKFMNDPVRINVRDNSEEVPLTRQIFYEVRREDKPFALKRLIDTTPDMYAIVFCRTRADVDELAEQLKSQGCRAEILHGDVAQAQRTRVIELFKLKKFRILLATDVAARGIDVNDLTHVINYSLPMNSDTYIHRIGRTGRAGKTGVAITFVTPGESRKFALLRQNPKCDPSPAKLPSGADAAKSRRDALVAELAETIVGENHLDYKEFAGELLEDNDPVEVVAALLSAKCGAGLLDKSYADLSDGKRRDKNAPLPNAVKIFVAAGKRDNCGITRLLELIFESTGIRGGRLGKISCFDKFSYVEASEPDANKIIAAFQDRTREQRLPYAEIARDEPPQKTTRRPEPSRKKAPKSRKVMDDMRDLVREVPLDQLRPRRKKNAPKH